MSDRTEISRRFPRIASHCTVLVRSLTRAGIEEFAHTTTLALGGCAIVTDEEVPLDSTLELLMTLDHQVVQARGRVVYGRSLGDGRHEIGLEFTNVDDDYRDLIEAFLKKVLVSSAAE